MAVYLHTASARFAKNRQKRTACALGQAVDLPYFNAFDEPLLSLDQLYGYLEEQIAQTLEEAGWTEQDFSQMPILLGSTAYVISDCEARFAQQEPMPSQYSLAVIAEYLQARYQTQVFSLATSCTSSAQAIQTAYKMLKNGLYDKALVVGFEMFNRLTFEHFFAMNLLSFEEDYQPLVRSNGLVLGEGIGCVALSSQPSDVPCEILAVEGVTDNLNLTNNSQQALEDLLSQCLAKANVQADQITCVKPHGVGGASDEMEKSLLARFFPKAQVLALKSQCGHTLGASGAIETALLLQEIRQNPPLAEGPCLSYFLGFGGSNVAWILKWGNDDA
ncbi:beta-ketoacyl synthase [Pasteurellaceae bacterium RH1A]|nr:beta-ketoacyl synthase [Pasteurellaceae bacterium RH1A]